MPLLCLDSSALVKLIQHEPETSAMRAYISESDLVSCEVALTEGARAIRRAAAGKPGLPLRSLMERASDLLNAVALLPLDRSLLLAAGALAEPTLRALDTIHLAAALADSPLDAFVGYDERQHAAARLAGLRTVQPA